MSLVRYSIKIYDAKYKISLILPTFLIKITFQLNKQHIIIISIAINVSPSFSDVL